MVSNPLPLPVQPSSAVPDATIRFERLTKRSGPRTAVRDLTLEVRSGTIYALLGPNGVGKTTALRCLATLLRPSGGTALVAGADVRTDPLRARRSMAFLAVSMGLYERLTARELVTYFGRVHGLAGPAPRARVDEMVHLLNGGVIVVTASSLALREALLDPEAPPPLWLIPLGVVAFTLGARVLGRAVPRSLSTGPTDRATEGNDPAADSAHSTESIHPTERHS